jgi:hypothetical protein
MKTLALSFLALVAVSGAALADSADQANRAQFFAVQQVQGGMIEGRNSARIVTPSMESENTLRGQSEAVRTGAIDLSGLRVETVNLRGIDADGAR